MTSFVGVFSVWLLIAVAQPAFAQAPTPRQPRGTATDVSNTDLMADVQKMATAVADVQLRVVALANQPNVGVGIVKRTKP